MFSFWRNYIDSEKHIYNNRNSRNTILGYIVNYILIYDDDDDDDSGQYIPKANTFQSILKGAISFYFKQLLSYQFST